MAARPSSPWSPRRARRPARRAPPAGRHVVGRSPSAAVALADPPSSRTTPCSRSTTAGTSLHPARRAGDRPDRRRAGRLAGGGPRRRRACWAPAGCASVATRPGRPGRRSSRRRRDPWRRTCRTPRPAAMGADTDPRAGGPATAPPSERRRPAGRGYDPARIGRRRPRHALADVPPVRRRRRRRLGRHVGRRPDRRRPRRPPGGGRRARDVAAFVAAVEEQRAARRWRHHVAVNPGVAEAVARDRRCAATCGRRAATTTTPSA